MRSAKPESRAISTRAPFAAEPSQRRRTDPGKRANQKRWFRAGSSRRMRASARATSPFSARALPATTSTRGPDAPRAPMRASEPGSSTARPPGVRTDTVPAGAEPERLPLASVTRAAPGSGSGGSMTTRERSSISRTAPPSKVTDADAAGGTYSESRAESGSPARAASHTNVPGGRRRTPGSARASRATGGAAPPCGRGPRAPSESRRSPTARRPAALPARSRSSASRSHPCAPDAAGVVIELPSAAAAVPTAPQGGPECPASMAASAADTMVMMPKGLVT